MGSLFNNNLFSQVSGGGSGGGAVDSVNGKTGNVILTAADINVTYTHEGAETTTSIKEFADTIDHNIENLNNLMPVNAVQSTTITTIVKLTQEEYDALETKDDKTLYYIV